MRDSLVELDLTVDHRKRCKISVLSRIDKRTKACDRGSEVETVYRVRGGVPDIVRFVFKKPSGRALSLQ